MTTGRITFKRGGHASAQGQLVPSSLDVPLSAFAAAFAEIETARKTRLSDAERRTIALEIASVAERHRGMRDGLDEMPKAQDVRATLLALSRAVDEEAFLAAWGAADPVTHDKVALAAWKAHKREGDRTPSEILARLSAGELRKIATLAAEAWGGGQGRRPPNEHDRIALRTLAQIWSATSGTKASAGSKATGGPFARFAEAARAAVRASWPTNFEAIEGALRDSG